MTLLYSSAPEGDLVEILVEVWTKKMAKTFAFLLIPTVVVGLPEIIKIGENISEKIG